MTVNFGNTSSGTITSYAWTFGDGGTSTAAAPSHVYSAAGTYTVKLTVTGPGGSNTQTRTNYVVVSTPPPPPVAQFTGTPTSGPFPLTVSFSNTSTGSITSYAWTFGDGGTSTAASPSHVYSTPGTYSVALTVTGPGGSNTQTRSNYVSVAAQPDVGLYRKTGGGAQPPYRYLLDYNFDHVPEVQTQFGLAGDVPLVGKLAPGGKSSLIMYRNGWWLIDTNRDGVTDLMVPLGMAGDIPLTANFSGPGQLDDIAIYRAGFWYVDTDLNGTVDQIFALGGMPGDIPLAGDVNGDGVADLAIYRKGFWYIDTQPQWHGGSDGGVRRDADGRSAAVRLGRRREGGSVPVPGRHLVREHEAGWGGGRDLHLRHLRRPAHARQIPLIGESRGLESAADPSQSASCSRHSRERGNPVTWLIAGDIPRRWVPASAGTTKNACDRRIRPGCLSSSPARCYPCSYQSSSTIAVGASIGAVSIRTIVPEHARARSERKGK